MSLPELLNEYHANSSPECADAVVARVTAVFNTTSIGTKCEIVDTDFTIVASSYPNRVRGIHEHWVQ